jgi:hypothetical protein
MKYPFLIMVIGYAFASTHAQTLTNQVVANAGNSFSSAILHIDQTTGESITNTFQTGSLTITQGFHQPNLFAVGVKEIETSTLSLWPNPARESVTISGSKQPIERIEIFDAVGKLVVTHAQKNTFNVEPLAAGSYVVRVHSNARSEEHRLVVVD